MQNTSDREIISFYNVENLFTPDDAPKHKLDPTESGLYNWDERRYTNKISKIANVFQLMKERESALPMLIGISEIQGRKPLEDVIALAPFNSEFGILHYESMDERGVDVALLYDKSKIEIISSEPLSYFFTVEGKDEAYYDTTRDVLFCKVKFRNKIINVFVVHLPSKRERDVNKSKREYILKDLHEKVRARVDSKEAVIILGDFNENPDEEMIENFVYDKENSSFLTNPFHSLFQEGNFSTYHYKSGLLFDQMMLSREFSDRDFPLQFEEAKVFNHEKLQNWDQKYSGRPFRTYAGTRYLGGYSDHFPVLAIFQLPESTK